MRKITYMACLCGLSAVFTGCTSHPAGRSAPRTHDVVAPSLVTPSPAMHALAGPRLDEFAWEYGRNDAMVQPPLPSYGIAEIRHRESLRTINGRPREFTTTRSRSIRWIETR